MLYWIFDLDYTLYNLPYTNSFCYSMLNEDNILNLMLNDLPSQKLIFTNGTYKHCVTCLSKINISNNFSNIIARDIINDLKPNFSSYYKFIELNQINRNDLCIFFEDSIDNLIMAKNIGWITVLITNKLINNKNIDFQFPSIKIALNFFLKKINHHLKP